jgi:hypothetical protein
MKKLVTVVSNVQVQLVLCCSAAVLLTACGGGTADMDQGQSSQTAAATYNSGANTPVAALPSTDNSTPDTAIQSGAEPVGAPIEPAYDSPPLSTVPSGAESGPDLSQDQPTRLLAGTTVVPAASYHLYVATTGSDSNPGTQAAPLKTIARADALARAGHIIHVAPGTYKVAAASLSSAGIRTTKSGTATARISFVSDVKWGAKIVFSGTGMAWNSKGSYVDITGFDISGTGRIGILIEGAKSNVTKNIVHDLTVSGGCNGSGGSGINSWGPGGNLIDSNVVRNIGYQWVASRACNTVQGIYITNASNRISNNIISGAAAVAINNWHGATASTIVNNTMFNSKIGIWIGQGDSGATSSGSANNFVGNNIIYNTAYGVTESGTMGGNNRYVNNLLYNAGVAWRLKTGVASGTIAANPLFVNYQANGTGDYRLQGSSPAINRGTATLAPTVDIAGVARPRGAAFDIGAYEY